MSYPNPDRKYRYPRPFENFEKLVAELLKYSNHGLAKNTRKPRATYVESILGCCR